MVIPIQYGKFKFKKIKDFCYPNNVQFTLCIMFFAWDGQHLNIFRKYIIRHDNRNKYKMKGYLKHRAQITLFSITCGEIQNYYVL